MHVSVHVYIYYPRSPNNNNEINYIHTHGVCLLFSSRCAYAAKWDNKSAKICYPFVFVTLVHSSTTLDTSLMSLARTYAHVLADLLSHLAA